MQLKSNGKLETLIAAALAIPGLTLSSEAQNLPENAVRLQYSYYSEEQRGREDRMRIHAPMFSLTTAINDHLALEGTLAVDSMSGASPHYLNTLSSASIRDTRKASDIKLTYFFDRYSIGIGGVYSSEDDYLSRGALLEGKFWTPDKNTTLALGISGEHDFITSTLVPLLHESRDTLHYFTGITRVLNQRSLIQSNLSYSSGDGFYSDPYKTFDNRPRSREEYAWLTRYNLYFSSLASSLHLDYRYYRDTWKVSSHTVEVAWHQSVGDSWIVRPHVRYYFQNRAGFFSAEFPPNSFERFYSADQRLSDFGSIGGGINVEYQITENISADVHYETSYYDSGLKLGGTKFNEQLGSLTSHSITFGVSKKF